MDSCKLSGADYFMLAMERHVQKQNGPGYVCRFVMVLNGHLSKAHLQESITRSTYFELLQRVRLHNPTLGSARWKLSGNPTPFPIFEHQQTGPELPLSLLNRDIKLPAKHLCEFDLIHTHDQKTVLVFSWHHLLMDGFGANKLLASLNDAREAPKEHFLPKEKKETRWEQWKQLVFAKDWLRAISKEPLVKIKANLGQGTNGYLVTALSNEESEAVSGAAARFSKGLVHTPYHLACAARAFEHVLSQRKQPVAGDFFVPMPMETRKRGANGPVLTNQHSMLFFRIKRTLVSDKAALVKEIGSQLFEQVKQRMPQQYSAMTRMLRLLPTWFYYRLIQRPNGDSIAAFLFSQSPSPDNLSSLLGHRLLDATALPPNTAPPGISFQIMTFEKKLKIVLQYSESCFSQKEANLMIQTFKQQLVGAHE